MSSDQVPNRGPERPRAEPEIIPPGADDGMRRGPAGIWMRIDARDGAQRIFIARPGLGSVILGLVMIGFVAAVVLLVLAGIVLLWVPILVGGILLALLSGAIRRRWRQLQVWRGGGR